MFAAAEPMFSKDSFLSRWHDEFKLCDELKQNRSEMATGVSDGPLTYREFSVLGTEVQRSSTN